MRGLDAIQGEIEALESEIMREREGLDPDLVDSSVRLKGLEEKLYSARAQFARLSGRDLREIKYYEQASAKACELKVRAARSIAADELREMKLEDEGDEAARKALASLN